MLRVQIADLPLSADEGSVNHAGLYPPASCGFYVLYCDKAVFNKKLYPAERILSAGLFCIILNLHLILSVRCFCEEILLPAFGNGYGLCQRTFRLGRRNSRRSPAGKGKSRASEVTRNVLSADASPERRERLLLLQQTSPPME